MRSIAYVFDVDGTLVFGGDPDINAMRYVWNLYNSGFTIIYLTAMRRWFPDKIFFDFYPPGLVVRRGFGTFRKSTWKVEMLNRLESEQNFHIVCFFDNDRKNTQAARNAGFNTVRIKSRLDWKRN